MVLVMTLHTSGWSLCISISVLLSMTIYPETMRLRQGVRRSVKVPALVKTAGLVPIRRTLLLFIPRRTPDFQGAVLEVRLCQVPTSPSDIRYDASWVSLLISKACYDTPIFITERLPYGCYICEYERYIGVIIVAAFFFLLQLWKGFEKTLIVVTIGFAVAAFLARICTLTQLAYPRSNIHISFTTIEHRHRSLPPNFTTG